MRTSVVIIGAGQAGLAMSRCLTDRSVDHVLLERGRVAEAWRSQRWDSLRLLTPNWLTRLPSWRYTGPDPDGYMTAAEVAGFLDGYRRSFAAPVVTDTTVTAVRRTGEGFLVRTTAGEWRCAAVVVASGAAAASRRPSWSAELPARVRQVSPLDYRDPGGIEGDHVLVVGASASGVQIADELGRSGRRVTLSVGDHVRVPRRYRGRDIHWWMDATGLLAEPIEAMPDARRARSLPSMQLLGSVEGRSVDLDALQRIGVELVGRAAAHHDGHLQCSGSLANLVRMADLKLERLLDRIDAHVDALVDTHVDALGMVSDIDPPDRPPRTRIEAPRTSVDLRRVDTIVWATGFRPDHSWLDPELATAVAGHDRGVGAVPGIFLLGLPFMRRRSSSFIDGVGTDATEIADHLLAHLAHRARTCA